MRGVSEWPYLRPIAPRDRIGGRRKTRHGSVKTVNNLPNACPGMASFDGAWGSERIAPILPGRLRRQAGGCTWHGHVLLPPRPKSGWARVATSWYNRLQGKRRAAQTPDVTGGRKAIRPCGLRPVT